MLPVFFHYRRLPFGIHQQCRGRSIFHVGDGVRGVREGVSFWCLAVMGKSSEGPPPEERDGSGIVVGREHSFIFSISEVEKGISLSGMSVFPISAPRSLTFIIFLVFCFLRLSQIGFGTKQTHEKKRLKQTKKERLQNSPLPQKLIKIVGLATGHPEIRKHYT